MRALQAQLSCAFQAVALVRPAVAGALGNNPVLSVRWQHAGVEHESTSGQEQSTTHAERFTSVSGRSGVLQLNSATGAFARPLREPTERLSVGLRGAAPSHTQTLVRRYASEHSAFAEAKWQEVAKAHKVNPCNSRLHPAVKAGILPDPKGEELCVQDAYNPESSCWGCGPAHPDGLQLKSRRIAGGLEARLSLPAKYCAFPGIVNGGVLSTIIDCHGNWTAAIALMDRACLPRPPLTLTASVLVTYKEPTPPDTELLVRSRVVEVKDTGAPGLSKASVEVDVSIYLAEPDLATLISSHPAAPAAAQQGQGQGGAAAGGADQQQAHGRLLAHGTGVFVRSGARRSL